MADPPSRLSAAFSDRYRIERELGEGGMATVYLAEDLKHDRQVAIKVLKPELSAVLGAERFVAEIKTTAQLQHPNILPLYDSGEADSFLYYVMPHVEGETLRERLAREKQLSVEETLRIAKAVGGALDFAHKKGVVHRDIKPANILLQDGQPLVADFGIALAVAQAGGGRLTETGLSLGTPHYMSPEQATADRDPDARSDVYSLGCVVYEMLTGEPPHLGGSTQAVLARVLTETPRPVRSVRPTVPTHVDATLAKALQKLPADRFDTAADFVAALEGRVVVETTVTGAADGIAAAGAAAAVGRRRVWPWLAVAAGALGVGGVAGWLVRAHEAVPPTPEVRMYLKGDSTYTVTNACCGPSVAISPDGRRIVFMARTRDGRMFYRRDLDDPEAHPVAGTGGGLTAFLDPSGRWLGFLKGDHLMKTDLSGGSPETVADVGAARIWGATWSDDGFIYFTYFSPPANKPAGIYRVSAQGGTPKLVSRVDTTVEAGRADCAALPGGRGLLYVSWPENGGDAAAWVWVLDLKDGTTHRLTQGTQPYYADGYLVYAQADGSIMARPFDPRSLRVTGSPVRIGQNVLTHNGSDTEYAVSRSGTLVLRHRGVSGAPGAEESVPHLHIMSLTGAELHSYTASVARGEPTFSPDGRELAFVQGNAETASASIEVWVLDLETGLTTRLSTGSRPALSPIWSADGRSVRWIEYGAARGGVRRGRMMSRPADLSGPAVPFAPEVSATATADEGTLFGLPSRSGGPIPFQRPDSAGNLDLWIMNADGTDPRPFLRSPAQEMEPAVSPSGKWIAYVSDETGQDEVWVEPFPQGGPRFRISKSGGQYPVWVSDHEIVFRSLRGTVTLADLDVTPTRVRATRYTPVMNDLLAEFGLRPLDASPGGKAHADRNQTVLAVVSFSATTRLLVETNRMQQIGRQTGGG